jgi:hypothetical protein
VAVKSRRDSRCSKNLAGRTEAKRRRKDIAHVGAFLENKNQLGGGHFTAELSRLHTCESSVKRKAGEKRFACALKRLVFCVCK